MTIIKNRPVFTTGRFIYLLKKYKMKVIKGEKERPGNSSLSDGNEDEKIQPAVYWWGVGENLTVRSWVKVFNYFRK